MEAWVGGALAKIVRVLPERIASPVRGVREVRDPGERDQFRPSQELTTALIEARAAARRLRLTYRPPDGLDALRVLEEHLSQGWTHQVDVLVHATVEETAPPRPSAGCSSTPPGGLAARPVS
jgi:hypothetical protein